MASELTNIVLTNEDNTGSVAKIWFVPVDDVVSIPRPVDYIIPSSVVLVLDKNWYTAQVTQETPGFEDKEVRIKGSKGRSINLKALVPGHSPILTSLFRSMELIKFLVIAEDQEGNQRLLGSVKNPMRFRFSFDTGNKTASAKGYTIEFYHTAKESPYFYFSPFISYPDSISSTADFITLEAYLTAYTSALVDRVVTLEAEMDTAQADIITLQTDLLAAQGEIDDLQADLITAEGEIDTLQMDLITAEGEIDTLQADLITVEGEVDDLQTDLITAEGEIDVLQAEVDALQALAPPAFPAADGKEWVLVAVDGVSTWVVVANANGTAQSEKDKLEADGIDDWSADNVYVGITSGAIVGSIPGENFIGDITSYDYKTNDGVTWHRRPKS